MSDTRRFVECTIPILPVSNFNNFNERWIRDKVIKKTVYSRCEPHYVSSEQQAGRLEVRQNVFQNFNSFLPIQYMVHRSEHKYGIIGILLRSRYERFDKRHFCSCFSQSRYALVSDQQDVPYVPIKRARMNKVLHRRQGQELQIFPSAKTC